MTNLIIKKFLIETNYFPLTNNAIDRNCSMNETQDSINKKSKIYYGINQNILQNSFNDQNKRLRTHDIMFGKFL